MKRVLVALLLVVMFIPFAVRADSDSKKVTIYMFKGDGCPHCAEALEWFDSLDKETSNKINLVQYEVWNDQDNNELMQKVIKVIDKSKNGIGVPYIIIGDKSFIGFADSYKSQILSLVDELYGKEDIYDVMEHLDDTVVENNSKAVTVIIAFVVLAAAVLIYYVSKSK